MAGRSSGRRRSKRLVEQTRADYLAVRGTAERLLECLRTQLSTILEQNSITLGVPMEGRIKTLASVEEKLTSKAASVSSVSDLMDLVGVRLILLFRKDLVTLDEVIKSTFRVVSFENTGDRLDATQFGYLSNHYSVRLPESWLEIPSYTDLGDLVAEIQVRTLAQHMWAAASHKLQYKREESVPPPLRRTIHRVSALLETVDLEFERVLIERASYVEASSADEERSAPLNVDLVAKVLADTWPPENEDDTEDYDELLRNLNDLGVTTTDRLQQILAKHKKATLQEEREYAASRQPSDYNEDDMDRYERGVYYTHVGLTRDSLGREFGRKRLWQVLGLGEMKFIGDDDDTGD